MATREDLKQRPIEHPLNPQPQKTEDEENEFLAQIVNWICAEMEKSENPFIVLKNMVEFIIYLSLFAFEKDQASRKWLEGGYGAGMISN